MYDIRATEVVQIIVRDVEVCQRITELQEAAQVLSAEFIDSIRSITMPLQHKHTNTVK
jgi:ABC-type spermidine/putrescine transport system permease subunit II